MIAIERIRKSKLIRLSTIEIESGKKKAKTGIQAGHAPSSMPTTEPVAATFLLSTEQQGAIFLL